MKQHISLLTVLAAAAALTACGRAKDDEFAAAPRQDNSAVADAEMSASRAADRTAQLTGDMTITAKVSAALVADDQLKATQINVDTRAGQVTLTGEAPDAKSRERAATLAAAVDGVKQVSNQLAVSPKNG